MTGPAAKRLPGTRPDHERAFGISRVFINGHEVLSGDALDKEALKTSGHALKV